MSKFIPKLKPALILLVMLALCFYLLPLGLFSLGGFSTGSFIFLLVMLFPFICFVFGFIHGFIHGFPSIFPIVAALLFVPTLFIYLNYTGWIYIVIYFVILIVGNLAGWPFYILRR